MHVRKDISKQQREKALQLYKESPVVRIKEIAKRTSIPHTFLIYLRDREKWADLRRAYWAKQTEEQLGPEYRADVAMSMIATGYQIIQNMRRYAERTPKWQNLPTQDILNGLKSGEALLGKGLSALGNVPTGEMPKVKRAHRK